MYTSLVDHPHANVKIVDYVLNSSLYNRSECYLKFQAPINSVFGNQILGTL